MTEGKFKKLVKHLHNTYGKRAPEGEVLDFLWEKTKHIPDECAEWIEQRFTSMWEKWPTQFHSAVLGCWHDWRKQNPRKSIPDQAPQLGCDFCVRGILLLAKFESFYEDYVEYSANCGHCRSLSDSEPNIPMMTLREAKGMGFIPWTSELKAASIKGGRGDPVFSQMVEEYKERVK